MNSFFTWHIFLEVGKTQDLPSKIWQTLGDARLYFYVLEACFFPSCQKLPSPLPNCLRCVFSIFAKNKVIPT
jgi:hypothetical protein